MLKNNIRLASTVNYFDIQFINNEWYAWFYERIDNNEALKEIIPEEK